MKGIGCDDCRLDSAFMLRLAASPGVSHIELPTTEIPVSAFGTNGDLQQGVMEGHFSWGLMEGH